VKELSKSHYDMTHKESDASKPSRISPSIHGYG